MSTTEEKKSTRTVCVTGASGFIASHVVLQCLQKGFRVHGTVRDSTDTKKNKHLLDLPGAAENLRLFSADLLKPGSFDEALKGCDGVLHTATPVLSNTQDGENDVYKPGVQGLQNILTAVKSLQNIKTFVLTSSMSAMQPENQPAVKSEADWSNAEEQKKNKDWYYATKTTQEQMAQKFFEEERKDVRYVSICPAMVIGPMLQEGPNATMQWLGSLCKGEFQKAPNDSMSIIDVRDTAAIHVAAYEKPDARGRYLCVIESWHWNDILAQLKKVYPKMPDFQNCDGTPAEATKFNRTRQDSLGVRVRDFPTTLKDAVEALNARGQLCSSRNLAQQAPLAEKANLDKKSN